MGGQLRSHLDLIQPQLCSRLHASQERKKLNHDLHAWFRVFEANNAIFVRGFAQGVKWLPGTIVSHCGPLSYLVKLQDGRQCHRHISDLRQWHFPVVTPPVEEDCLLIQL